MRLPELLFASTLAIFAILAVAVVQGEVPGAGPTAHPDFPSMLRGNGASPSSLTTWLGWAFGALQIAFFAVCFALGLGRRGSLGPLRLPVLASLAVYAVVCLGIGLWAMRRTRNARDFFAAGRSLGVLVTGVAIFSSTLSGFGFVGGPGLVYRMGMSSVWLVLTSVTGYVLTFALLGVFGAATFAAALVTVIAIGFNWKRATARAANVAIGTSLVVNLVIELFGVRLPHGIHGGVVALCVSLLLFFGISLASQPPRLEPDIEAVLDG